MLEANTAYSFFLCEWHVTVEWGPVAKGCCEVRVMIHDPAAPLHGSDVAVGLLDIRNRPLPMLNPEADHGPMMSVVWAARETQHKWVRFGRGEAEPGAIEIVIRGHRATIPLAGGRKGKARATDAGDGPKNGGGDQDGDDGNGDDDKDGGPGNGGKAKPKCCLIIFETPTGSLPTTKLPVPGFGAEFLCQPWVVIALFSNDEPCRCTCCEYRQYVKGTMTFTPPGGGAAIDISPVTDFRVPAGPLLPGAPPLAPVPIRGVNPNFFVEDSAGRADQPGNPIRYGPRNQAGNGIQDYPTPCSYWAFDGPAVRRVVAGARVAVDIAFRGEILDICRDVVSRGPNFWDWKFNLVA